MTNGRCDRGTDDARVVTGTGSPWPSTPEDLATIQEVLARAVPPPWRSGRPGPGGRLLRLLRPRPERARDRRRSRMGGGRAGGPADMATGEAVTAAVAGRAPAPYVPGLLALREGPLLEAALRALPRAPTLLVVNATGGTIRAVPAGAPPRRPARRAEHRGD